LAQRLRWGIIGTGAIAHRFAAELTESRYGMAVSVGSRSRSSATAFAERFGLAAAHSTYDALLADDRVDVVYIATPHHDHARWAIRGVEAGKHVRCEKPLALHRGDAEAIVDAARANGVFLMEAFMYRCHPQTRRLLELVRGGVLGELRMIEAVHSFRGSPDPSGRLLDPHVGGGAILDVGCYCMSAARLVAGVGTGREGAIDPLEIQGIAHLGPTGVDGWAVAALRFPGGVLAHLATGVQVDQPPALRLHGTEASVEVEAPWLPGIDGSREHHITVRRGGLVDVDVVTSERGLYAIEADEVAACIRAGLVESSTVPWADTLGNMAALDAWRARVGLSYPAERTPALTAPVRGHLRRDRPVAIPRGSIKGVPSPASRLVLGTMLANGPETWPTAMAVFDAFFEAGGNMFDSARRYGQGESDRALGHWMRSRGVRNETIVIAKGAHTPHCDPETVTMELELSLEDLQTDHADLYFMHRDNADVPVGEFVDVLNRHHRAGRMLAFGGFNWSIDRLEAANRYAEANGLTGFSAVSNQFSLAKMVAPTFPGCVSSAGLEWADWLDRSGTALVAWSSQAAGYFAGAVDPEVAHAWLGADNLERRLRAESFGRSHGATATTVALAWVLAQPTGVFAIVGPRRLAELRDSLKAVDLVLTPRDVAWLDLGAFPSGQD
jgi:predicted dehydrogenase/aryl-alcohol dehydrogenase-like predicted oxidoreductase